MSAPRVLFVSLTNDVGTDRLVADVGRAGALCAVMAPPGSYAGLVRCVAAHFPLPGRSLHTTFALAGTLDRAVATWAPDRVVPLDDLSATLLRTMATRRRVNRGTRIVLQASFGAVAGYDAALQRVGLMQVAARSGVRVPAFAAAAGRASADQIADELGLPVMVKRDQSSGSGGVVRVETRRQLATALRFAQLKTAAKASLAHLAGVGRPLTPALVQRVVEGRLAMFTAVCREGHVIDGMGFAALESHPVKRSSTILQPLRLAEMEKAARRLVAALGCSGFVSFDFLVDRQDRAVLIEMNPRPIGSAHLGRLFGHDLATAFVTGQAAADASAEMPLDTAIALFPKELERDPSGQCAANPGTLHDVPEHEPAVLAAYVRHLRVEHPTHAAGFDLYLRGGSPSGRPTMPPMAARAGIV